MAVAKRSTRVGASKTSRIDAGAIRASKSGPTLQGQRSCFWQCTRWRREQPLWLSCALLAACACLYMACAWFYYHEPFHTYSPHMDENFRRITISLRTRRGMLSKKEMQQVMEGAWSDHSLAADLLKALARRFPYSTELRSGLAIALARRGHGAEALRVFTEAAQLPPASLQRIAAARVHNVALLAVDSKIVPRRDLLTIPDTPRGGWTPEQTRVAPDAPCDIDTRLNLSVDAFTNDYVLAGRPVLLPLRDVARVSYEHWTRAFVLSNHGSEIVPILWSSNVTQAYDRTLGVSSVRPQNMLLSSYVADILSARADERSGGDVRSRFASRVWSIVMGTQAGVSSAADAPYLFATGAVAERLAQRVEVSGLASTAAFLPPSQHKRILFLGPPSSGSFFHDHSNALNLLIYGRKRWALFPPSADYELDSNSEDAARTLHNWEVEYTSKKQQLPLRPMRCIQPAGTALFVPSGWKHAVVNEQVSIGVAIEVGDAAMIRAAEAVLRE